MPSNFDHCAPATAESRTLSNQCYFHRHEECWMSKLCDCSCHQEPKSCESIHSYAAGY